MDHDASVIQAIRNLGIYFCKIDKEKRKRAVKGDRRRLVNLAVQAELELLIRTSTN
jgi:hypothetical protein